MYMGWQPGEGGAKFLLVLGHVRRKEDKRNGQGESEELWKLAKCFE